MPDILSPYSVQTVDADSSLNHFVPSAAQGMMILSFATFSMMASPGSAKDGASVRTKK